MTRINAGWLASEKKSTEMSSVPFFSRLLDFPRSAIDVLRDKRRAIRYPINPSFPLRASIYLHGSENWATFQQNEASLGREWLGPLADISSLGVSICVQPAAVTSRGERTKVRFILEKQSMEVPCTITHSRSYRDYLRLGVSLQFTGAETQKPFFQLLECVVMGATLEEWSPLAVRRNPKGLRREQYRSINGARLFAWREKKTGSLHSFEFYADSHCVRGEADGLRTRLPVEVYVLPCETPTGKVAAYDSRYGLAKDAHEEARQFFRLVVLNLSTSVPLDLRRFLTKFQS